MTVFWSTKERIEKSLIITCRECDVDTGIVTEVPPGWTDLFEEQDFEAATYAGDEPDDDGNGDWECDGRYWTHTGFCPECSTKKVQGTFPGF